MKDNKTELVRKHLVKKGQITTWEAITKYRATRLSDIKFVDTSITSISS